MSDPFDLIIQASGAMIFWAAFVVGFMGSAHCVGMCGGLVAASAPTPLANGFYQLGRLLAYGTMGVIGGFVGQVFLLNESSPWLAFLPSLTIGLALIWMGLSQLQLPRLKIGLFGKWGHHWMLTALKARLPKTAKAFLVGFLSFLLPCGFLYGALFVSLGFQDPLISLGIMSLFWLGTLPAMSFAPEILRRFLAPLQKRSPVFVSLFFISLGVGTLAWRFYHFTPGGVACH